MRRPLHIAVFKRVVGSYSLEEKVISLIAAMVVFVALFNVVYSFFRNPDVFSREVYTEGWVNEKATLINPLYSDLAEVNRNISALVFSGLMKYDPDRKTFVEDMGEMSISEDKKTYRFMLKEGILWHDSTSVTADDVYFTFHDVIQHPDFQNPVVKTNFANVVVNKINERTVEFTLQNPNSFFITNLNIGILPRHILASVSVRDLPMSEFNSHPIGSGPYVVDQPLEGSRDGKSHVLLRSFDKYYGIRPKVQYIRFAIYPTFEQLLKDKGTLNLIPKVLPSSMSLLQQDARFKLLPYVLPQYTAVFMNMESPILKTEKVRVSLQKAIDKKQLLKQLPSASLIDTPIMELNQKDWIYKPNIDEANGGLFDSGYTLDKNSKDIYRKDDKNKTLTLRLVVRDYEDGNPLKKETQKVVSFLVESWKKVGIKIVVDAVPFDAFTDKIRRRDYDLLLAGQSLGYNLDTYAYWHSKQAFIAGLNLSNYKSFAIDSLIERMRGTFDVSKKSDLLKDLAQNIAHDVPALFLYTPQYLMATDNKVKGVSLYNMAYTSDRFAHIAQWCIVCEQ